MKKLLVYKQSKLEWDAHLTGLTRIELIKKYDAAGANTEAIVKADEHQKCTRLWMEELLNCKSETLEEFTMLGTQGADLIISLGGDNSFTRISQFCSGNTAILGINSDPRRSIGHLLSVKLHQFGDAHWAAKKINQYEYQIEEWPRIQCKINGLKLCPSTSEIFLGEKLRKNMSRHVIEHNMIDEAHKEYLEHPILNKKEQKCSGLIIATGAGSTGWLMSASQWAPWPNAKQEFRYMATEPYTRPNWAEVSAPIYPKDILKVISLNDDGIASIDAWDEYPFNRGSVAEVSFGETLKVMKFVATEQK